MIWQLKLLIRLTTLEYYKEQKIRKLDLDRTNAAYSDEPCSHPSWFEPVNTGEQNKAAFRCTFEL